MSSQDRDKEDLAAAKEAAKKSLAKLMEQRRRDEEIDQVVDKARRIRDRNGFTDIIDEVFRGR